jgi:hypothetical protein
MPPPPCYEPLVVKRPSGQPVTYQDGDAWYSYFNNGRAITITGTPLAPIAFGNWTVEVPMCWPQSRFNSTSPETALSN